MRHHAFDQFVTSVAAGGSRRWALKAVLGGALGSALTMRASRSSLAIPPEEEKCRQGCVQHCRNVGRPFRDCIEACAVQRRC